MGRPPGAKNKPKPPAPKRKPPAEYKPKTDYERAMMLVSTGVDIRIMAELMGCGVEEFRKRYRKEMTRGHDYVYGVVTESLVRAAFGGDQRAQMAWLRQFGGWMETTRKEITGRDGQPISIQSLDGPSLLAIVEALGQKDSPRRVSGRNGQLQIDA